MGKCTNCGKEISLKEGERLCPGCGELPYICWECKNQIDESSDECAFCGYFICNTCGQCGKDCSRDEMARELIKKFPNINSDELVKILDWFGEKKKGYDRYKCPKGVPISYAKTRLRNWAVKLKGFYVKGEGDRLEFKRIFDDIEVKKEGDTWTITEGREPGEYGIELRDASNMSVCMGIANVRMEDVKNKQNRVIGKRARYTRIDKEKEIICPETNHDKLIVKKCLKCKNIYPIEQTQCNKEECRVKKGKHKGELRELVEAVSHVNFCQLPRKEFIKQVKDGMG